MVLRQSDFSSLADYQAANRARIATPAVKERRQEAVTALPQTGLLGGRPSSSTVRQVEDGQGFANVPNTATGSTVTGGRDSVKPIIRDLPTPSLGANVENEQFLTSLGGKTLNELTPDEITKLIEIERGNAEQQGYSDLGGYYNPQIKNAGTQVDRLTQELANTTKTEQERIQEEINRNFGLVDTKYAPEIRRLQEGGARAVEDTQRSFSFNGASRGTRADTARQVVIEKNNEIMAAKDAEIALEKRLLQAQIQGESDTKIQAISKQLDDAKTARSTLEANLAEATAGLSAQLATQGQGSVQSFLDTLTTQASMATYDANLSSATGQIVDSRGRPINGPDGKPLVPATLPSEASADISKQLGYLADNYGNAITDSSGQTIPVNKGVKSTFQDGAKNTYILFEDGSVQQIGQTRGGGSGGSGGGGSSLGAAGYNPAFAPIYDNILQYASEYTDGDIARAVDDLALSSNSAVDRENYILGASNYYAEQVKPRNSDLGAGASSSGQFAGVFPTVGQYVGNNPSQIVGNTLGTGQSIFNFLFGK